jgi:hypothetical protein
MRGAILCLTGTLSIRVALSVAEIGSMQITAHAHGIAPPRCPIPALSERMVAINPVVAADAIADVIQQYEFTDYVRPIA